MYAVDNFSIRIEQFFALTIFTTRITNNLEFESAFVWIFCQQTILIAMFWVQVQMELLRCSHQNVQALARQTSNHEALWILFNFVRSTIWTLHANQIWLEGCIYFSSVWFWTKKKDSFCRDFPCFFFVGFFVWLLIFDHLFFGIGISVNVCVFIAIWIFDSVLIEITHQQIE